MTAPKYDMVTVGGGLGGSALARAMAERGLRVLVVEAERQFKDRVRGEFLAPWGVAEARALGLEELLRELGAYELPWWDVYLGVAPIGRRDLTTTTTQQLPALGFYHPAMQETLLAAAANAGAEVRRGSRVRDVSVGRPPSVTIEADGHVETVSARLVVGADGRASSVRHWAGFTVERDPDHLLLAGVLLDGMHAPDRASTVVLNPMFGQLAIMFPQAHDRARAYLAYLKDGKRRLQGTADVPRFIEECVATGMASEWYADATPLGPLASFDGADSWVTHPYCDGIVLVGDAAATSDPTHGQGLSLTLRDVRVLRDALLAETDWDRAGHAYAAEHDRHYAPIHTCEGWLTQLFLTLGPEADSRRERALPLIAADPSRIPDFLLSGPELPLDDSIRRRFFGED
jgi:2-polyprenyl-6-methoxyphenol hydroxylase-like FAD-dependent oxidoreductase